MTVFGGRRKSAPWILLAAVAGFSLLATTAANAVITTTDDLPTLANAVAAPGTIASASQALDYVCEVDDPATPEDENVCPSGISDSPIGGFPREGSTYGIITTGNAALADDANTAENTGYGWFTSNP